MNINIQLSTPTNGQRQVQPTTNIVFSITSDNSTLNSSTLQVQIDGVRAITNGVLQTTSTLLNADAILPSNIVTVATIPVFQLGESVQLYDAYSGQLPDAYEGPFTSQIHALDGYNGTGYAIRLASAVSNLHEAYGATISSLARGFQGTIASSNSGSTLNVSVAPLTPFALNRVIIVIIEVQDGYGSSSRSVFNFRTTDTVPPQLFNFPTTIRNSELGFRLVDILQNDIHSVNVSLDGIYAIQAGVFSSAFVGSLGTPYPSEVDVFLRPVQKFRDQQSVLVYISASDSYGNLTSYTRRVINHADPLTVQLVSITPPNQSVLDPQNHPIQIYLSTNHSIDLTTINLDYTVDGYTYHEITKGVLTPGETGSIRVSETEIVISLPDISNIFFNSNVGVTLFLQNLDEHSNYIGYPFFTHTFEYSTTSSNLAPTIDSFTPLLTDISSPSTPITFRVISLITRDPVDLSSITVIVNSILAIDGGVFVSGFTGAIQQVFNSNGNAVTVNVLPNQPYLIGSTITVDIQASDTAHNLATATHSFIVANINPPIITMTPPSGVFNQLTRITIATDQPSIVYYTVDGSIPQIGNLHTYVQASPVTNVPIYSQGTTQIKAFATNVNQINGPLVTGIYYVNSLKPQIQILSPNDGLTQDLTTVPVHYSITLESGYLTQVQFSVNNGVRINTNNTLSNSSILITGLLTGANTITIFAIDNANNIGKAKITVVVNPSKIFDFALTYAALECPQFVPRTYVKQTTFNDFIDTKTVVIIGYGHRTETLVSFALGDGLDGFASNFIAAAPDGRHFELASFPVIASSFVVLLTTSGAQFVLPSKYYTLQAQTGEFVLDNPLAQGQSLTVQYISLSDINNPTIYTSSNLNNLFAKHGQPTTDNPLSLAAQMAFDNGATRVLAVQPLPFNQDSFWSQTWTALERQQGYWLVPVLANLDMGMYATIRLAAFEHAIKMSETKYRMERVVVAARQNKQEANDFNHSRLSLIGIDLDAPVTRYINNVNETLNYSYVAATVAGLASSFGNVATPLTRKHVTGFNLVSNLKSPRLDLLDTVSQGFMPIQVAASGGVIYQGPTSYIGANILQQEVSVQRITDYLSYNLRDALGKGFIGQNITNDLLAAMTRSTNQFLARHTDIISQGIVASIAVDSKDPRQVNLTVSYSPLFPLNALQVSFTVSTFI
jgi:hypothetical protein